MNSLGLLITFLKIYHSLVNILQTLIDALEHLDYPAGINLFIVNAEITKAMLNVTIQGIFIQYYITFSRSTLKLIKF